MSELLQLEDLKANGLLWLINTSVFHPRGYAIGLVYDDDGTCVGWTLMGDGSDVWTFDSTDPDLDDQFTKVKAFLP